MDQQTIESFFLKKLTLYDQRIKSISSSIKSKNSEIKVLELAYQNLLQDLEKIVGPKHYAEFVRLEGQSVSHIDELTLEEQLLMIKTFDFNVPVPESDPDSAGRIKKFQELVLDSDLRKRSVFQALVNSPEFDQFIYSPDFGVIAGNHDLTAVIKGIQFKNLAVSAGFKHILRCNGIKLPLNPQDEQLQFKLKMLKTIAKRDAILEDFKVKRQSSLSPTSRDFDFTSATESPIGTTKWAFKQYPRTELSFSTAAGSPKASMRMLRRKKSSGLIIEKNVIPVPFK